MQKKLLCLTFLFNFYVGQCQFFEGFENTIGTELPTNLKTTKKLIIK